MNQFTAPGTDWSMSDRDFDQLREVIYRYSGIVIGPEKRSMIRSRLQRRLCALKLNSMADYLKLVSGISGSAEREHFISSLTTNVTSFFRESHHFDLLTDHILPGCAKSAERITIWSAGCSSGQEPYSIAMAVVDKAPSIANRVQIVASDIDAQIIERARSGRYSRNDIATLPKDMQARHFVSCAKDAASLQINQKIARMVNFQQLNLNADWPVAQQFDVVFCRNVAIYFDQQTQRRLWRRFHMSLRSGGWLLIGHSERVPADMHHLMAPCGITSYRKTT